MILTEDKAKTKRCQESFAASPGAVRDPITETIVEPAPQPIAVFASSGGSMATISTARPATAPIFCLGSACMAWQERREGILPRDRFPALAMNELQARRTIHAFALYRAAMRRSWRLVPTLVYYVLHNEDMCLGGWWAQEEAPPANDNRRQ